LGYIASKKSTIQKINLFMSEVSSTPFEHSVLNCKQAVITKSCLKSFASFCLSMLEQYPLSGPFSVVFAEII